MSIIKTLIKPVAAALIVALLAVSPLVVIKEASAQFSTPAQNLAGLIAVDEITDDGSFNGNDNLEELIILGGLFPTSFNANQNAKDLAGLIAVDNIVSDGSGGAFGKDEDDLAALLVLNNLFLDP